MARDHLFIQLLILLLISTTVISGSENQISQSPAAACVGKNVTVMCTLNVPERADIFISPATNFIYGDYIIPSLIFPNISNCSGLSKNNSNFSSNIISYLSNLSNLLENISNISSYNISTPVGNSSRVFGAITLNSYTTTDKSLRLGCINYFYDNGSCSVVESVSEILYLEQAEPPSLVNCTVNNTDLDPYTCNFRYGFSWTSFTGKVNGESFHYSLLASNSVLYSINSSGDFFNYSDATSLMPGDNVNFTLRTENCAGVFSAQCFEDVFPIYEIVNGSISVVFSLQTNIFTVSWNLKRNPPNSSDHLILLKYKINIQVDYKYNEQNSAYTQTTGDLERDYLSNVTSTTETFMFDQVGTTLGRIDLLLNIQIVQQCGHNISGDLFTSFFNFSEPPTGFNCTVENSNIDPYTCSLPYRFAWTSPTNKLDMDSLGYTLLINNVVVVYVITSMRDYFNFSDNAIIMPGQGVNFSLTAQNFAGVASQQCFTDVIPFYEIVNGSIDVVFSLQTSIFTVFWNLKRNPPNSSDHLILLKYKINIQVDYKYNEQNSAYTQTTGDLERDYLSNVTSTTETFMFDQAGTTLGRIDLLLNIQIVEQCGHNISGDLFTSFFNFSEPPTGFNCTVENSNIDPYTCSLPYRFAWTSPTNKFDMDSLGYTLLINNVVVVYAITSMRDYFNFSDNAIIMPGQGVNFSLTAQNFAGVASQQCFTDVIPFYEIVNGSINVVFSLQTSIFTVSWNLKRNPPNSSDHLILLKYKINIQVDYKYNEQNSAYTQTTGDLERDYLSNVTSTTETFMFDQAGTTLGRIDLLLNIQIVEQCGHNISGDLFTSFFNFSEPPTGFNCTVENSNIDPYTCSLPYRFAWTSPTNKLDMDSLGYTLLINNVVVVYAITSMRDYFNFSDNAIIMPGQGVNFSLTAQNFAGVASQQCFTDVIPYYEFVNGSINITYSRLTNNFTFYWNLMRYPPFASEHVTALNFIVYLKIDYRFNEENSSSTQTIRDLDRVFFSNVSSTNVTFDDNQVGLTLGRMDAYLNVQIAQQCGFSISGDTYPAVFRFADPPTGFDCSTQNILIDPYTCRLPYTITWTSPFNKLDQDSLEYNVFANNTVVYMIDSARSDFNFSNTLDVKPGESVNFTLTVENFADRASMQCFDDVIPSYDFLNGSINVEFSPQTNNFTFLWELEKSPSTASDHLMELTFLIQLKIDYKFSNEKISHAQTDNITRKILNNILSTNETFNFPQVGFTLERVDLYLTIQIVQQCNNSKSGDVFNVVFNYTGPHVCKNISCFNDTDLDGYPINLSICPHLNNRTCIDNCPCISNPDQSDCDGNGIGDVCDTTCEPEVDSVFSLDWVCSMGGAEIRAICLDGNSAIRKCLLSGDWSEIIDASQCVSPPYANITKGNASQNLDNTLQTIMSDAPIYSGDVSAIVEVLESTIGLTTMSSDSEVIVRKTVHVIDFLVDSSEQLLLNQAQLDSGVAQKVLGVLDRQAGNLVDQNLDIRLDTFQNIFFETRRVYSDVSISADNIKNMGQSPTVNIPITENVGPKSVSVIVVQNIGNLITSFADSITVGMSKLKLNFFSKIEIVTPLVSVQIFSGNQLITTTGENTVVDLNFPLDLTQVDKSQNYFRPTCLFLANLTSNNSQWQDEGIGDVSMNDVNSDNVLTCSSGHTTAFVVLIGINSFEEKSIVLNVYTYFGCVVAIACLLISIAIYLLFGRMLLKKIHHFMHFQLAISLCLLYLVFLLGVEFAYANVWHYIPCKMITVLIEYLLLVVFLWMLFESVVAFIMIIWPIFNFTWKPTVFFFCMAWLLPIFYVVLFIPFFHESYFTPPNTNTSVDIKYCWVYSDWNTHILYSIVAPLASIVLVTLLILLFVFIRFVRLVVKYKSYSMFEPIQKTGLNLFCLIFVLSLLLVFSWTFGLLTIYFNYVIFSCLFAILSCFQGVFFLIFVLLVRSDVQLSIVKALDLESKISTIKSKIFVKRSPVKDPFRDNIYTEEPKYLPEVNSDWDVSTHYLQEKDDWRSKVRELEAGSNVSLPSTYAFENFQSFLQDQPLKSSYETPRTSKVGSATELVSMLSFYEEKPRESVLEKVVEETPEDIFEKIRKDLDDIMTQVTEVEW